jgi:hypothetical protein
VLQLLYTLVEAREKAGADLPTLVVIAVATSTTSNGGAASPELRSLPKLPVVRGRL